MERKDVVVDRKPDEPIVGPGRSGALHLVGRKTLLQFLTQPLLMAGIFPAQGINLFARLANFLTLGRFHILHSSDQMWKDDVEGKEEDLVTSRPDVKLKTSLTGRTVSLETFQVESKKAAEKDLDDKDHYYLIHCPGNSGQCNRFFPELVELVKMFPNLTARTFNHQGNGKSGGWTMTYDDLVDGAYAEVMSLINSGVDPSKIILSGFSIGAATAAITADKLRATGHNINLFCDRTFDNMANVVTYNFPVLGILFRNIPPLGYLFSNFIIRPLLWLTGWNMDPATAYKNIPAANKSLMFVKPRSAQEGLFLGLKKSLKLSREGIPDKRIPEPTSLQTVLTNGKKAKEKHVKLKELLQQLNHTIFTLTESIKTDAHDLDAKTPLQEGINVSMLAKLLDLAQAIKAKSDNGITYNAAQRICSTIDAIKLSDSGVTKHDAETLKQLTALAIVGYKGKRLAGMKVEETVRYQQASTFGKWKLRHFCPTAHDVNRYEMNMRKIHGEDWLEGWKDYEEMLKAASYISGINVIALINGHQSAIAADQRVLLGESKEPTKPIVSPEDTKKFLNSGSMQPAFFIASVMDRQREQEKLGDEAKTPVHRVRLSSGIGED